STLRVEDALDQLEPDRRKELRLVDQHKIVDWEPSVSLDQHAPEAPRHVAVVGQAAAVQLGLVGADGCKHPCAHGLVQPKAAPAAVGLQIALLAGDQPVLDPVDLILQQLRRDRRIAQVALPDASNDRFAFGKTYERHAWLALGPVFLAPA